MPVVLAALWSEWSLPDWFSVVGFPLGIIGIAIAVGQVRGAKSAAEEARDAIKRTETQVAENHLLVWSPQLTQATRTVDFELRHNAGSNAPHAFHEWRVVGKQVRTLMRRSYPGHPAIGLIDDAILLMPTAEEALEAEPAKPLERTRHVRESMIKASDEAHTVVAERMAYTRDRND